MRRHSYDALHRHPLLILAGMVLLQQEARATTTYAIIDYPAFQNGFTIEGSITTDGTLGTLTNTDFIQSWNITILKNDVVQETYGGGAGATGGASLGGDLLVTSKSISLDFTNGTNFTLKSPINISETEWQAITVTPPASPFAVYSSSGTSQLFWAGDVGSGIVQIATVVPEPTSALLAGIGVGSVMTYVLVRKRRVRQRQTATH
jgi:hypothetical protein